MSRMKTLFDYMFRVMDEFKMMSYPHDEVLAMATGLRDGEDMENPIEYSKDSRLQGFYKQGFKHAHEKVDSNGFKI